MYLLYDSEAWHTCPFQSTDKYICGSFKNKTLLYQWEISENTLVTLYQKWLQMSLLFKKTSFCETNLHFGGNKNRYLADLSLAKF
jgi:hypothetical protein